MYVCASPVHRRLLAARAVAYICVIGRIVREQGVIIFVVFGVPDRVLDKCNKGVFSTSPFLYVR